MQQRTPSNILLVIMLITIALNLYVLFKNSSLGSSIEPSSWQKTRIAIKEENTSYINLKMKISKLFFNYEKALNNYGDAPTQANHDNLLAAGANLDAILSKASQMFGLNVKRPVALFKAWQYRLETGALSLKGRDRWDLTLLTFQSLINEQIGESMQTFRNNAFDHLLYGPVGLSLANPRIQAQVDTIYEKNAKTLMPQAIQALQNNTSSIGCLPPDNNLTNPKNIAEMVTYIQYQSRYCPQITDTEPYCTVVRNLPAVEEREDMLNHLLALCHIGEQRLQAEAKTAQEKYGQLTYSQYYQQYVAPLVPQQIEQFKKMVSSKNINDIFRACDPSYLPVVDFRDPVIDARIAAYEQISAKICHTYFANPPAKLEGFARLQQLQYYNAQS